MVKCGKEKNTVLRSFSYGNYLGINELPENILHLFDSLIDSPTKRLEFASEIVDNGLKGRIDFSREFNIDAYEATIRKNQSLGKEGKKKREVFIDTSGSSDDWEEVASNGGIKLDQLNAKAVDKIQDAYEQLLIDDELKYAVDTIKMLNDDLMIEESIDLIHALKQAVKGIPDAIKSVSEVCTNNSLVSELVETILSSGYEISQIFS